MTTKANKAARSKHFGEVSSHTRALQNVMNANRRENNVRDIKLCAPSRTPILKELKLA